MPTDINLLDHVRIASPCSMSWKDMEGTDRVRYCGHCRLNVYNLSALSRPEAESLIQEKEGRLCAAYYQRRDGTILTADCPDGLQAIRRRFVALAGSIAVLFAIVFHATGLFGSSEQRCQIDLRSMKPFVSIYDLFRPQQQLVAGQLMPPVGMTIQPGMLIGEIPPQPEEMPSDDNSTESPLSVP